MRKNTKFKGLSRAVISRLLCAILLLGVLGGILTSCATGTTKATTLRKPNIDFVEGSTDMTKEEVTDLATKIKDHDNALLIREKLVAAQRGYDISTDEKYNATKDDKNPYSTEKLPAPDTTKSVEYAKAVLQVYGISYSGDLDEGALEMLVNCFREEVDVNASKGVLDQLLNWVGIGFGWLVEVPGFGSFILGTLYFAIALEILMLPIGIRQQKNSIKQAKLRPREMAIRNKYKGRNDQATMMKLNEEIRTLYASEGYSPMSGCLPLLITLPFLLLLYYVVLDPMVYMMGASKELTSAFVSYATAHPAAGGLGLVLKDNAKGTITVLAHVREGLIDGTLSLGSLSDFAFFTNGADVAEAIGKLIPKPDAIPDFTLFNRVNLGDFPEPFKGNWWLMLVPVLTFVVYWGSGKITRKMTFQPMQAGNDPAQGCSNGMMNIMMPAMSAFFTFMVPAAIGIYWMFKSIVATGKQVILAKVMPLPVFTEEDYKAAERELAGKDKQKPQKKSGTRNPNVRSLHHIDDEDYDPSAPAPARISGKNKPDYVEPEEVAEEKPRTADNAYSEGVTLKEDRPAKKDDEGKKDEE